ncbi:MAG TPA: acido-empty-quinoprotein group A [Vicinamibacterales bacterium]|nr:acido-empty-quinoprotein group A [Vicinamibacterales bacterium]
MRLAGMLLVAVSCVAALHGQGIVAPSALAAPTPDSWPMHNGDYSGRRFSELTTIDSRNVASLSLGWTHRITAAGPAGGGGTTAAIIKGTPVVVNGVLYVTIPDHVWALDARSGRELWHASWPSKGGWHIGNRGVAVLGTSVYVSTPDCHLLALDNRTGKEKWRTEICDLDQFYYASAAPLVVKNHVIVGVSGDDLDIPGYIESHDPETGARQWRWYTHPEPGTPEAKTWPSVEAMLHGGGMTWGATTYDAQLNLIYFGTGNPQPVINGRKRQGDNLYTESIVALNPDTGQLAWYFQASPHDTHDWDATQTPVLFDGTINGQPRKLLAQAARNGWFFVLDRETGRSLSSREYVKTNWALGVDAKGQPMPNPRKEPQIAGALVSPNQAGGQNWPPPSFSPQTGLFYVNATRAFSVYYLYENENDDKPQGWAGNDRGGWSEAMLLGLDYQTGQPRWRFSWEGSASTRSGLLSTAGNLLFAGDSASNFVAFDAARGVPLWRAGLHASISNGPITYQLDGVQYVVVAANDTLYAFASRGQ